MVRTASTGDIMLVVVFGEDDKEKIEDVMGAIADKFPQITSLLYVVNLKVNDTIGDQEIVTFKGKDYIEEEMSKIYSN